jgi:hypothetical protein
MSFDGGLKQRSPTKRQLESQQLPQFIPVERQSSLKVHGFKGTALGRHLFDVRGKPTKWFWVSIAGLVAFVGLTAGLIAGLVVTANKAKAGGGGGGGGSYTLNNDYCAMLPVSDAKIACQGYVTALGASKFGAAAQWRKTSIESCEW